MIHLSELDVLEVKDHVKRQKRGGSQEEEEGLGEMDTSMNQSDPHPSAPVASGSNAQLQLGIMDLNRRREVREERLGMR